MTNESSGEYTAKNLEVLEGLQAVRKRPGMYIGGTDNQAMHHLAYEIMDNCADEAVIGEATKMSVTLNPDGSMTVSDDGRGIPVDPYPSGSYKGEPAVKVMFTVLHAGGKFGGENSTYKFSGGLHGVGSSVVNALSKWMNVEIIKDGKKHTIGFSMSHRADGSPWPGDCTTPLSSTGNYPKSQHGTTITFLPDEEVFGHQEWNTKMLLARCKLTAFLNSNFEVTFTDNRDADNPGEPVVFLYQNGLHSYMEEVSETRIAENELNPTSIYCPIIEMGGDTEHGEWRMAMRWFPDGQYRVEAFANGIPNKHGGKHVEGYERALTRILNRHAKYELQLLGENDANLEAVDVRAGLGVLVSVKVEDPQFRGQTKDELQNEEARTMVQQGFSFQFTQWLMEHPGEAQAIIGRAINEMRYRHKALAMLEDERKSNEPVGKSASDIPKSPKLKDCRHHGEMSELFIVEGDSALGSVVPARDPDYQAALPIRGKIINLEKVFSGNNPDWAIENNKELQGIIGSMGCGSRELYDPSKLRFGRVIILTDADDDGAHIETLLITLFQRLMPDFVAEGRLFIAQPPLFSAKYKGQTFYFHNEVARSEWEAEHPDFQDSYKRYKGLGEMNVSEIKSTTVSPATRHLLNVVVRREIDGEVVDTSSDLSSMIANLMGKNAQYKWDTISKSNMDEFAKSEL